MTKYKPVPGCRLDWPSLREGQTLYFAIFHEPTKKAPEGRCEMLTAVIGKLSATQVVMKSRTRVTGFRQTMPRRDHADWRWVATTPEGAIEAFRERTNEVVAEARAALARADERAYLRDNAADVLAERLAADPQEAPDE